MSFTDAPAGPDPKPSLGRIVIFRDRAGVDMPAIITEVTDPDQGFVHLTAFPPPRAAPVVVFDQEWGWPHESQVFGASPTGCWRWPERTS
jgi:hypothetical protein